MNVHVEPVMGTLVGFASPDQLPPTAVTAAVRVLHDAERVFSTWIPDSPISLVRSGRAAIADLDPDDADQLYEVLARCELARELTRGAFDPWGLPGGVDPTGLVKGWAAARALEVMRSNGVENVIVNAGGDIAVSGSPGDGPWRIGVRHPSQLDALVAVVSVERAIATSGDYERPGQLFDPRLGRTVAGALSATVTGPDLDLADALATGLAVGGGDVLTAIDGLPGYEAYLVDTDGRHYATPGMAFAAA